MDPIDWREFKGSATHSLAQLARESRHFSHVKVANPAAPGQYVTMNATLTAEISRLSPAEKILLVEELWDQIASASPSLPVPVAHREELDRRLASDANDVGLPWSEVRDALLRR